MSARPKIAIVNPLVLDSTDRKARLFTQNYRVDPRTGFSGEDRIVTADVGSGVSTRPRPLTQDEMEIAVFCLNNWNMISAAIKAVN